MSLQIWLPLNGNLQQQGLSSAIVASEGTVAIDSNGKIGKCYKFGTEKGRLTFPVSIMKNFTNACSIAFWVKINTWNTNYATIFQCGLGGTAWTAYRFGILRNNNNKLHLAISDGTNSYYSLATNDLTLGQWYHICFTYTTGKCSCYVNGIFLRSGNTTVIPAFNGATVATIGAINASGGYQCDMYLNDFRIYDHCLSQKEVEEISKGLVLHYKLDNNGMGNLNLVDNSNWAQGTYHWTNWGSPPTREIVEVNGKKWIHLITNTTRFQGYSQNLIKSFGVTDVRVKPKSNTQYTLSFTAYAASAGQKACIGIHWNNGTTIVSQSWIEPTLTTTPTRYSAIVTSANSTIDNMNIMVGDGTTTAQELWITDVKVEVGNKLSNWSPYDDNSVIYDSSGYNNNGTIVGSLETTTTSLRYSCATKMTNGQYIRVNNRPATCMPKDAITVNLWQYATSWANPISCTEGGGWNFENSSGIRFPVYISGVGYKVAQSSITPASTQNAWHMLTGTMNKDNIKIYYDGEEVGTVANGSTNGIGYANNYIFIGAEASGDNTSPANSSYAGNLSDVRIYATALTANQIKELYNTSMTIDNNGNIHTRELVE